MAYWGIEDFMAKEQWLTDCRQQIGYGSNKKTRHLMPSGHKAFLVNNGTHRVNARRDMQLTVSSP
jgi:ribosomal protein L32E